MIFSFQKQQALLNCLHSSGPMSKWRQDIEYDLPDSMRGHTITARPLAPIFHDRISWNHATKNIRSQK